jgi:hypothetical protein
MYWRLVSIVSRARLALMALSGYFDKNLRVGSNRWPEKGPGTVLAVLTRMHFYEVFAI